MVELNNIDLTSYVVEGMMSVIEPLMPYLLNAIFFMFLFEVIKWLWHNLHAFLCFEESARERRKAHKRIDNIVDFISNIIDLMSNSNSDDKHK